MLLGQLCGICGNYNQQIDDEFILLPKRTVMSYREYMTSKFVPSGTCRVAAATTGGVDQQDNVVGGQYVDSTRVPSEMTEANFGTFQHCKSGKIMTCSSIVYDLLTRIQQQTRN